MVRELKREIKVRRLLLSKLGSSARVLNDAGILWYVPMFRYYCVIEDLRERSDESLLRAVALLETVLAVTNRRQCLFCT